MSRVIEFDQEGGYAAMAGEVLVFGGAALKRLAQILETRPKELAPLMITGAERGGETDGGGSAETAWIRTSRIPSSAAVIQQLRAEGFRAQPNHVFYADACGAACGPHPAWTMAMLANPLQPNPFQPNPFQPNPFQPNPLQPNPLQPNPLQPNPLQPNPLQPNRVPLNLATPARERALPEVVVNGDGEPPLIAVIDTGIANPRPALLESKSTITGDDDKPSREIVDATGMTHPADNYLDPVAGHGTFIAGLIEQLVPGCRIHVESTLRTFGDTDEALVTAAILDLIDTKTEPLKGERPDIIAMSFSGQVSEASTLASAIAQARQEGVVLVASAGNSATCVPQFPAAFPGVIGVGALGPVGPAPFSNYGDWVDASAPGVGLVSSFFKDFDGDFPMVNSVDPDAFKDWASWSGTSFSTPVVVAALAREMIMGNCTAQQAVDRVIHAPHLMRVPCMGTVVNH